MLFVGWRRGYVPSHVREKRDTKEVRSVVAETPKFARIGGDLTIEHRRGGCALGCTSLLCTFGIVRTLCPAAKVRRSSS